jgi:hypothetical protein
LKIPSPELVSGGGDQAASGRLVGVVSGDPDHLVPPAQRIGDFLHFSAPPDSTTRAPSAGRD